MSTPNLELLDDVMQHIDTHPEEWDQANWFCGTTACFAGHACARSGYRPLFHPDLDYTGRVNLSGAEDGDWCWVGGVAQLVLGLTDEEAQRLFDARNTLDDLHSMVKQIHGAPDEDLSWERAS
jgi:hypothetical protein